MFKNLSFILLVLLFSCTHTSNSTRKIASEGDLRDCRDVVQGFIRGNPIKSGPILTGANSMGMKIPDFENFRSSMLNKRPSIENFTKKYKEQNQNRLPSNLEVINFYEQASADLVAHIRSAKGINERLDLYLELSAAEIELSPSKLEKIREFKTLAEFRDDLAKEYDPRNSDSKQFLEALGWTNYKGHLGELDVLLRLENLQAQGVYLTERELLDPLAQEVNTILSNAFTTKMALVNENNVATYIEKYPNIFKNVEGLTPEQAIAKAKNFLETKEFDLVIKKNNKFSFVEVKNYKEPISTREARVGAGHKKTILDQQLETLEIIQFLGLEDSFYPTVAFLRGVTPEAREVFESRGVSVLAEVIDPRR
ncbi:hypothetical exported protein [Halobacteriovorax marinus SJ]|uniref:Hypothetical exported protein n=1 Tax=Halobacteriovorax marinus (strain ATCC BAA-682 / DSM 15412 / SJ) TaxID=862908 RepID=E1X1H0_HALMS|nr:hypothetical protein [Halobacteriovorax marinus]CBW26561.1 hypothetical exported protein [Halobacteriovorax marinus SJ]